MGEAERFQAVRVLLAACPSATADSLGVDDEDGPYLWVGALARHLVDELVGGRTVEVAAALAAAETLLGADDLDICTLVQVGLFEDLQNDSGRRFGEGQPVRQEDFDPFLGPRSVAALHAVNTFWAGSTTPDT